MKRSIFIAFIVIAGLAFGAWWMMNKEVKGSEEIFVNMKTGTFDVLVTTTGELQAKNSVKIYGPRKAAKVGVYELKIDNLVAEGTNVSEGDYVAALDKSELLSKVKEVGLNIDKSKSQLLQVEIDTSLSLSEARNAIVNLEYAVKERLYEQEQSIYEAPATQKRVKLEYEKSLRSLKQSKENYKKRVAQAEVKVKEARTELQKSQRKLKEIRDVMESFTIKAPSNGMVIYHKGWRGKVKSGSRLQNWDPVVATLPDLSVMESVTYVNEIDVQKVNIGQEVNIGLDAIRDKKLTGKITSVANIGEQRPNSDAKVFEVKIQISESDTTLLPSMTTSNEIKVEGRESTDYIPLECLNTREKVSFVFMKTSEGKTIAKEVKTGLINENDIEVLAGISSSDKLFLSMPKDTVGVDIQLIKN